MVVLLAPAITSAIGTFETVTMTCASPLRQQERPYREYRWKRTLTQMRYRATSHIAANGGIACYGVDNVESYLGAASYVDRILKGEKRADLPVQLL